MSILFKANLQSIYNSFFPSQFFFFSPFSLEEAILLRCWKKQLHTLFEDACKECSPARVSPGKVYHNLWVLPPGGLVTRVEVCTFCILPSLAWYTPSEHGRGGCSFCGLGVSLTCKAWWLGAKSL